MVTPLKVCFVNRYFHPDISATSQMLSDLAFFLAGRGHHVHVVCCRQLYENAHADLPAYECIRGVHVHRVATTRFGRQGMPGRALDYLSFYANANRQVMSLIGPDWVVVSKTDPPLISIPLACVCRWKKSRLVNWLQDVFPEVATGLGIRFLQGPAGGVLVAMRDWSLRAAAHNVVLGERMAARIRASGTAATAISIVPNWSSVSQQPVSDVGIPDTAARLKKQWGLEGRFVAMYSGNMGRAHDFDTMLQAASLLEHAVHIAFLFVGGGARQAYVKEKIAELGLRNCVLQDYQPLDQLEASLSVGDVHLISLLPEMEGLIVPSKYYGIMAVGRPTIFVGDEEGEIAQSLKALGCGHTVPIGDNRGLAWTIQSYADAPARCEQEGRQAQDAHARLFQADVAMRRWEQTLLQVAPNSPGKKP